MHKLRTFVCTVVFVGLGFTSPGSGLAQGRTPRIFESASSNGSASAHPRALRSRHVRAAAAAIAESDAIVLNLFDDTEVTARRTKLHQPRPNAFVWQGRLEGAEGGDVTLAVTDSVVAGTAFLHGRTFEISFAGGNVHEIREIDPAAYPTDDPQFELMPDTVGVTEGATSVASSDTSSQIDVMVLWTPNARAAAGGASAIQSLVNLAVANANTAYVNSQINTQLRIVYSGELAFVETPSSITGDLTKLTSTSDGNIDQVHTLRNQYGADIVTLMGAGYSSAGYCGIGYLMGSPSTSFASYAFNVVDRACAAGNLSYAHEVGHNQGLHHDPPNASGTPSYPYAYGYQDPGGAFRTVMSYGGAPRVTHFSNPLINYASRPTGASTQNNASALNGTAGTVANFRSSSTGGGGTTPAPTPTCTFSVTPTSLSFEAAGGAAQVSVSAPSGCGWSAQDSSAWVSLSTASGSGPGRSTVTVAVNTGKPRSTNITVAGVTVTISQRAPQKGGGKGRNK